MATYQELADLPQDPGYQDLMDKIEIATSIKAQEIVDSAAPNPEILSWAKAALKDLNTAGNTLSAYVIAKNNTLTVAQIIGASDSAIQTQVNAAIDNVYG